MSVITKSNLEAMDGEQLLAIAVIEQARFDLGARGFRKWIQCAGGHFWLEVAGVRDRDMFVAHVLRKIAVYVERRMV